MRQARILELLSQGVSTRKIAARLGMCTGSLNVHRNRVVELLGIEGRISNTALVQAYRAHLASLDRP